MVYCDKNTKILEWGSEEIALPYISPHDSRVHRYFPDFYIKVQENTSVTATSGCESYAMPGVFALYTKT